jgi:hypothetical protein
MDDGVRVRVRRTAYSCSTSAVLRTSYPPTTTTNNVENAANSYHRPRLAAAPHRARDNGAAAPAMPPRKRPCSAAPPPADHAAHGRAGDRATDAPVLVPCELDPACPWSRPFKPLREAGLFIDAILAVGGAQIAAHRLVLGLHSSYLRAMFTSGLAESAAASSQPVGLDAATDAAAVAAIVDCFYTGQVALTGSNVCAIIQTAKLWCVDAVDRAACHFLVDRLEPATALDALEFARQLSEGGAEGRTLHASVLQYVHEHFAACAAGAPFLELGAAHLAGLLQRDELMVPSEEVVLQALRAWYEHDAAARRASLEELVPLIRFPQLPTAAQQQLQRASHPLLRAVTPSLARQLLLECHAACPDPATEVAAEAANAIRIANCPRQRRRCYGVYVASEGELRAALAQGGEVVVRAGTTIVLSAPLEITHDTAIVGRLDGAAPPTLLSRNEHSVIRSERGKALRLEGLALQVVSSDGGAGDAVFCSEDSDARSWPSRNRGGAGDGGAGAAVYALGGQLEMRDCSVTSACGDGCHLVGSCRAGFEGLHITDCRDYGIYVGGRGANLLAARVTVERFGREAVRGEGGAEVVLGDPGHNFVVAAPELRAGWYNSSDSSDSSDSDDSDDISSELGQPLPGPLGQLYHPELGYQF